MVVLSSVTVKFPEYEDVSPYIVIAEPKRESLSRSVDERTDYLPENVVSARSPTEFDACIEFPVLSAT